MSLEFIIGPMFSGKTSEMIRRADRLARAKNHIIVIRPKTDTRYDDDDHIITHSGSRYKAHRATSMYDIFRLPEFSEASTILIDEAHFFSDLHICSEMVDMGKRVILSGLVSDFRREPFRNMTDLLSHATCRSGTVIQMLSAVCKNCGGDAYFTGKILASDTITHDDPATTTSTPVPSILKEIDVGGEEKYIPLCQQCYTTFLNDKKIQS